MSPSNDPCPVSAVKREEVAGAQNVFPRAAFEDQEVREEE